MIDSISVQCPRGSYHNFQSNACLWCPLGTFNNETSQMDCLPCPVHQSTRKIGSKSSGECVRKQKCESLAYLSAENFNFFFSAMPARNNSTFTKSAISHFDAILSKMRAWIFPTEFRSIDMRSMSIDENVAARFSVDR